MVGTADDAGVVLPGTGGGRRGVERSQDDVDGLGVGSGRRLHLHDRGPRLVRWAGDDQPPGGLAWTALLADLDEPDEDAVVVGLDLERAATGKRQRRP